ncbi:MAG: hypothetical protein PHN56_01990 [Candidatus Nanoarchaeia archaeon]|nr:hypothetical protein [Candidatus Nanoarchaeia archaeon]
MYIIRKELMEKLLYKLKFKINTVIVGTKGVGKTDLLKYLESFTPNAYYISSAGPKQILIQILKKANIVFKSSELADDLKNKIKKIKNLIVLIDDADRLSKPAKRILEDLNATLILSSRVELKNNFESITLPGFNNEELKQYLDSKFLEKKLYNKVYNFIKHYSDSSPYSVNKTLELYSKNLKTEQVFSLFNFSSKKVEALTVASFISIGYLLMSLRYFFYSQKDFLTGYALSTTAYLLFFIFRRRK